MQKQFKRKSDLNKFFLFTEYMLVYVKKIALRISHYLWPILILIYYNYNVYKTSIEKWLKTVVDAPESCIWKLVQKCGMVE